MPDYGISTSTSPEYFQVAMSDAATTVFSVQLASGESCAGFIVFNMFAYDGTDYQNICQFAAYSAHNKAGTITGDFTYQTTGQSKNTTSGTLTMTATDVDSTNVATFQMTPTGSLTETTYYVRILVLAQFGNKITALGTP